MKPAPFEYVRPQTLSEANFALANAEGTAVAIAGGQSMMPLLALRMVPAALVVDIGRLEELKGATAGRDGLRIGAATTHAEIEDGKAPDPSGGLIRKVAAGIAYRAVRNHGTIGGSVALADPAADWPVCLIALGASARIAGLDSERVQPVAELVQGAYTTSLTQGEIITAFDVPGLPEPPRFGYAKVVRKSGAFAMAIGCVVVPAQGAARVVLGGTTTRAQLLPKVAALLGGRPDEAGLRAAIAADLAAAVPDADAYQQRLYTATILRAAREALQ